MKKFLFVSLTVLLVGLASCQKPEDDGKVHTTLPKGQLKVMSFNIRGITNEVEMWNNWAIRAGSVRDMLIDQKASVIGMQELENVQLAYITGVLEPRGYTVIGDESPKNPIVFLDEDLDILDFGLFWQSATPDRESDCWDGYSRNVRWAVFEMKATGDRFFFVNCHMGLTGEARNKGMALVHKRIRQYNTDNLPVIMVGDFNTPATDGVFQETRSTMDNAREIAPVTDDGETYNAWGDEEKFNLIDMVWLSRDIECLEYHRVTKAYDGHHLVSDHYPVYSIIKF